MAARGLLHLSLDVVVFPSEGEVLLLLLVTGNCTVKVAKHRAHRSGGPQSLAESLSMLLSLENGRSRDGSLSQSRLDRRL